MVQFSAGLPPDTERLYLDIYNRIIKINGFISNPRNCRSNRNIQYSFDTVTDEDVAKPDLTEYKLNVDD